MPEESRTIFLLDNILSMAYLIEKEHVGLLDTNEDDLNILEGLFNNYLDILMEDEI